MLQPADSHLITRIDRQIIYMLGCMAAILIFFQANFAFDKLRLSMNCADIFSLCGLSSAILYAYQNKYIQFKFPHIPLLIVIGTIVFTISLLVGTYTFGFTAFAFINKFLGLFVLIGYAGLGAIFIHAYKEDGLEISIKLMTSTMLTIIGIKLIMNLLHVTQLLHSWIEVNPIMSGYATNRNAFALQIMSVVVMQLALPKRNQFIIAFLVSGVFLTYSRSAIITTAVLLLVSMLLRIITMRELGRILLWVFFMVGTLFALEYLCELTAAFIKSSQAHGEVSPGIFEYTSLSNQANGVRPTGMFEYTNFSNINSDNQRMYSLLEAYKLWKTSPWWGIGLGSFANNEFIKNHEYLVIHSTYAWVITEFGLIGASFFLGCGLYVLRYLWRSFLRNSLCVSIPDRILFGLVIIFLFMAGAHEIFYQRIFWFLFGLIIVDTSTKAMNTTAALQSAG